MARGDKKDMKNLNCSFCGKSQKAVRKLIAGPSVYICDECVTLCNEIIEEEKDPVGLELSSLGEALDPVLFGQERVRSKLSAVFRQHHLRKEGKVDGQSGAALLIGPSGAAKVSLVSTLSRCLGVPFARVDASLLGRPCYFRDHNVVHQLMGGKKEEPNARWGVVLLDNLDLLAERGRGHRNGRRLQMALLGALDGGRLEIGGAGGETSLSENKLLFIGTGRFAGLRSIIERRPPTQGVPGGHVGGGDPLSLVTTADLVEFGLLAEFVQRFPVLIPFEPLSRDELRALLGEGGDGLLGEYKALFKRDGVTLSFTEQAIDEILREATRRGGDASDLRAVLENFSLELSLELAGASMSGQLQVDEGRVQRLLSGLNGGLP